MTNFDWDYGRASSSMLMTESISAPMGTLGSVVDGRNMAAGPCLPSSRNLPDLMRRQSETAT